MVNLLQETTDTPFLMKAVLEDGFKEPAPCCGNWTFAIADATIEATEPRSF